MGLAVEGTARLALAVPSVVYGSVRGLRAETLTAPIVYFTLKLPVSRGSATDEPTMTP